jgi:uncharacterized RDD family membrane protein YckC
VSTPSSAPGDRLDLPPEIVTGEAVALDLRPASFATRALAIALDLALMLVVAVVLVRVLEQALPDLDAAAGRALGVALFAGIVVGLPTTVETLSHGRSLGKVAAGLRVVRDDGGPIRMRHALVRALLGVVEIFFTLGSVALVTSLLNVRGKRLGDLLAGTFVLRERGGSATAPLPAMPPQLARWAVTADIARLPDQLAVGARRFLAGAARLHPASRAQLGTDLAGEVARFVAPPPPAGTHPEALLVAVLVERRRRDHARLARLEQARTARLHERGQAPVLSPTATRLLGD